MTLIVEHRVEAAEGHLVAHRATAELLGDREDVGLFTVEERRHPRRVDRAGADRREVGMLHDDLFDENLAALEQTSVEPIPILDVRRVIAMDAGARLSDRLLRHDRSVALGERPHGLGVALVDDHPVSVQVLGEHAVELDLVLEQTR